MIVDDDVQSLRLMSEGLTKAGYKVISLSEPEKAMELILKNRPDFVVLDILMPGTSGIKLCGKIKSNPDTKAIPIMFLSSSEDIDHAIASLHLGCIDYFKKPFLVEEIIKAIAQHDVIFKITEAWEPARKQLERVIEKYA